MTDLLSEKKELLYRLRRKDPPATLHRGSRVWRSRAANRSAAQRDGNLPQRTRQNRHTCPFGLDAESGAGWGCL